MKRLNMKKLFVVVLMVATNLFAFAQDAAQMINDGNAALKANEFLKAFELYDKAMKNLGEVQVDKSINFNIGYAGFQAEKFQESLVYFDKAIEAGINVPKCYEFKAKAYTKLSDMPKALEAYKKAIETTTEDKGNLYFNAAVTAYQGNIPEEAIRLFDEAIKANFKPNDAIYFKSLTYKKMNKNEEYKQVLIEGAEKFPTEKRITSALAKIYLSEGNELYNKGAAIVTAANQKVTGGKMKTSDDAYKKELDKAKAEFKNALVILEKSKALDASNPNVQKLIDACGQLK